MPVKSRKQMRKLEVLHKQGKISNRSIKDFERSAKGKKLPLYASKKKAKGKK